MLGKRKISNKNIYNFLYSLSLLLKNGVNIVEAFDILRYQEQNREFSIIIKKIGDGIKKGDGIFNSFSKYGEVFSQNMLSLIAIGEETGTLEKNLEYLLKNMELEGDFKKKIIEALIYPVIVIFFTIFLIIFMVVFVLPNFIEIFNESNIPLPLSTRILLGISENVYIILSLMVLAFIIIVFIMKKIEITSIPVLKIYVKKIYEINICRNLAIMLKTGVPMVNALLILEKTLSLEFYKKKIKKIVIELKQGHSLEKSFYRGQIFEESEIKLMAIGDKSREVSKILEIIGELKFKNLENQIFKLLILIEPLLILGLGIVVGFVILAVYLPIFNITDTIN